MHDNMFVQPSVTVGGKRKYTVLVSIAAHALAMAATVIVPLVATNSDLLPAPSTMITFIGASPLPPSPPPPQPSAQPLRSNPIQTVIPIEAPQGVAPEVQMPSRTEPPGGIEEAMGIVHGGDSVAALLPQAQLLPAAPQAPVRLTAGIKPPVKIKDVAPEYPRLARSARVEGVVVIEATIGPTGKVQDARVLRSIPLLDPAALDAVLRWEYTPTLLNGNPVAVIMTVTVHFRLR